MKSGVSERCWFCWEGARGPVNGLVLLGRTGTGSETKGFGEARLSASWERLLVGSGGGGSREEMRWEGVELEEEEEEEEQAIDSRSCRADGGVEWREEDEGRVVEENRGGGTGGAERREEPRVRDCVLCQDEEEDEERRSAGSVLKGSGFHCASLWNPFIPLVCAPEAASGLAASGGIPWLERERGGGLGDASPCGGPAWGAAAAAAWGWRGAGIWGSMGGGSWDWTGGVGWGWGVEEATTDPRGRSEGLAGMGLGAPGWCSGMGRGAPGCTS